MFETPKNSNFSKLIKLGIMCFAFKKTNNIKFDERQFILFIHFSRQTVFARDGEEKIYQTQWVFISYWAQLGIST